MRFCDCKSGKYSWRDVADINGKLIKVDEPVKLLEDDTFDITPIFEKLAKKYGIDANDVLLATFEHDEIFVIKAQEMWDGDELGGYCQVCGRDV